VNQLNRTFYPLFLILLITLSSFGQDTKTITLEDAFQSRTFSAEGLYGLRSMNDGVHYTVQNGNTIDKYSYKTGEQVETLFDAADFPKLSSFSGYHFNELETKILMETGVESIYRHSYTASYHVYDMELKTLVPVSEKGKQQLGTFSPDGSQVAFVRDNNLYIRNLSQKEESQITFDGVRNEIINGAPDWVYEEEFGFSQGFQWSPDGQKIAFYRFDERRVKEFHMTMFGPLYPESYEFKYPKAGEENSIVSIHVYNLESGKITSMDVGEEADQYIPRIKWTRDPEVLSIMRLNRLQNQLDILHANAGSGTSRVVYSESNKYYISEASDNTVTYLNDGESFILNSERDGYFHLYHYNFKSGQIKPITTGDYDISSFMGFDEKQQRLYYTSYEESSIQRHVYSIKLDGTKKQKLSTQPGTNRATFSTSFKYYILNHSSANTPPYITLHNQKGKMIRVLKDNERLKETLKEYRYAKTEFLTVPTSSGEDLNAWIIKPNDFDPTGFYCGLCGQQGHKWPGGNLPEGHLYEAGRIGDHRSGRSCSMVWFTGLYRQRANRNLWMELWRLYDQSLHDQGEGYL